jgi:predicted  nucleic acid-binding Zn-ribbon protein
METYYTKKEYNEMKSILNRKLKSAEKKLTNVEKENDLLKTQIKGLEQKIHDLEYPLDVVVELEEEPVEEETHVTED